MGDLPIQIVDEQDNPVGAATKQKAWSQGLIHRIVRVMLEDENGLVLLQKRSADKPLYPNCWDESVSGHVDAGESYDEAAMRELKEELGIEVSLTKVGTYYVDFVWKDYKLKRFNAFYRGKIMHQAVLKLSAEEVAGTQWFTIAEVKNLIKHDPEHVTDGLRQVIEHFY